MSRIKVDRITDKAGTGAPTLVNGMNVTGKSTMGNIVGAAATFNSITAGGDATFSANVSTSNLDVTGLSTFRSDLRLSDSIVHLDNSSTKIRFPSSDTISADTAGTERVVIKSDGKIGLGLNNPGLKLHIQDGALPSAPAPNSNCDVVLEGTTNTGIQFLSGTQTQLRFGDADSTAAGSIIYKHTDDNFRLNFSNSGYLSIYDGGGENLRFTPNNEIGIAGANYGTSGQVLTSGGAGAAVQWADAGGGAYEVVSTHALTGSTSTIDSNGWSNSYAMYKIVMNDIYYSNTNFRIYWRIYGDGTSGNAGTLKTGNNYSYGSMDGQEAWGGMSGVPRQGTGSQGYFKTAFNSWITVCNIAEYNFPMQTNVSHGNTYAYWYGTMNRNANIHLADNGLYSSDYNDFLTGIRIYFMDGSNNPINPSQGRVTILRMKYS